ncbi:hypothetical protein BN1723_015994 [Verticillium longisporum]|uniref:Myb-like domain-containing protein n=1 Tax=Verticillium longisporum TaxID=100787 RepID=A0A0G4N5N7_VERLO|nr:hypothetical protein BN1708_015964 [Verticillium longisporum]CRK41921.1 hypothetical protein BN1723_015994 [Verticillium longisporum]
MQISLDRIEFYQPSYQPSAAAPSFIDLTTPDSLRRSVCKLPRNEALSMPDERAERQRLRSHQPADENAIVISDDDGCDDDGCDDDDGDGNARDIPAPVPERQPSTADEGGILSSRSVSNFRADSICGPVVDPHHIEAFSQHPEKARDNVVFAGDGDSSTYCTLQAPSSLVLPALLPAPGASASEDDHDMGRVRTPSELVSSPAYDVLQPSLPHTGGSQDSSSYVSQASSDGSDAEGPERTLSPSPLRAEPLDQIIVTTTIDPTEGLAGSAASLLASSLSSQLSPSICEGLQLVQRDLQDTRRAQKYASCPNTTSNAFFASKNTVMATCTSPCDTAFVSAPFTTPRQRGRTRGPPLPSSVKRTRRTLPAHGFSQRRSARLRSTSSNALDAYIQHEANQNSESNIGPSSLDGSGSDESYTARSINSTEERSDSGLDEIDMPRRPTSKLATLFKAVGGPWYSRGAEDVRTSGIATPPLSTRQSSDRNSVDKACVARFEEWPLEGVSLKRVTVNGVATFQLQFSWDPQVDRRRNNGMAETRPFSCPRGKRHGKKHANSSGRPFTKDEVNYLIRLKEVEQLSWAKIHELFTRSHPGRTQGSLEVYYCTKLKGRIDR